MMRPFLLLAAAGLLAACAQQPLRGTGDLGVVVERATGSLQIIESSTQSQLARVEGLGDLSHASVVFSRDQRYAYVFGRDGGLSKVDLLRQRIERRVIQGGNSIGGAISQDGSLIAVGNYEPGGVKVFDAQTLELVADIPATPLADGSRNSRVVGVIDVPGRRFIYSLFDTDETWLLDFSQGNRPRITRFEGIGRQPYDALLTPEGRYYIAGLFGEDGMAKIDLWHPERGVERILDGYGRGQQKLPVYKMPHLEGWTVAGNQTFVPAVWPAPGAGDGFAEVAADRGHRRRRPADLRHGSAGRTADLGQLRSSGQRQGAGHRQRDPRDRRHPGARSGGAAHGVHRPWRPALAVGARWRGGPGLGPLHPEAAQATAGAQPERYLLQQPCPRDGAVTCRSTRSAAA